MTGKGRVGKRPKGGIARQLKSGRSSSMRSGISDTELLRLPFWKVAFGGLCHPGDRTSPRPELSALSLSFHARCSSPLSRPRRRTPCTLADPDVGCTAPGEIGEAHDAEDLRSRAPRRAMWAGD